MRSSTTETYVFDIDGTICEQTEGGEAYARALPIPTVIDTVRRLHGIGHRIVLFTARGMGTIKRDRPDLTHVQQGMLADSMYRRLTEEWLRQHDVPYDELIFGKPPGDHYVDDKGWRPMSIAGMFDE